MRISFIIFLACLSTRPATAADFLKASTIIKIKGNLVITDGSSFYRFDRDFHFESGPLSESGRTISGKWQTKDENIFLIEGQWSWINGASALNDTRKMTMAISPPCIPAELSKMISLHLGNKPNIYKCYFLIEELVKSGSKK